MSGARGSNGNHMEPSVGSPFFQPAKGATCGAGGGDLHDLRTYNDDYNVTRTSVECQLATAGDAS